MENNKSVRSFLYSVFVTIILCVCFALSSKDVKAASNDVVYIPDENFKAYLNKMLGVSDPTADITEAQMAKFGRLRLEVSGEDAIRDITGISYCTNLSDLNIIGENFKPTTVDKKFTDELKKLNGITEFLMNFINCEDYTFMENWTNLQYLDMRDCNIVKFPNIDKCTEFKSAQIYDCDSLIDISAFAKTKTVTTIEVENCDNLADISCVSQLKQLDTLRIKLTGVTDISPLKGLTSLKVLDMSNVDITDTNKTSYMETVASLINLEYLYLTNCKITDEHTDMFRSLKKLGTLYMDSNKISNVDFLLDIKDTLKGLDISSAELDNGDIPVLVQLTKLGYLEVRNNAISDYSFVNKLPNTTLYVSGNRNYTYVPYFTKPSTYVLKNKVKDANGNYVAPLESELYEYNSKTNEITVFIEKTGANTIKVNYEFTAESTAGKKVDVEYDEYIELLKFEEGSNANIYLEEAAILKIKGTSSNDEKVEFQWYKDGQKIEGATEPTLSINKAKPTDAGKYTVVIKAGDYSVTSAEMELTVRDYKKLTATLEIIKDSEDALYVGDYVTFKINVQDGSGSFYYYIAQRDDEGISKSSKIQNSTGRVKLSKAGRVEIYVTAYDNEGIYLKNSAETNVIVLNVEEELKGTLKIGDSTQRVVISAGDSIKLNIESTGGAGAHTYKYEVKNIDTGKIEIIKDYSTSTSLTIKELPSSNLIYTVYIKDSLGREVASNSVKVYVLAGPLDADYYVNGVQDNIGAFVGSEVKFEVKATGGTQNYDYEAIVYDVSLDKYMYLEWSMEQLDYSWTPEHQGVYYVGFIVFDSILNRVCSYDMDKFNEFEGDMDEYLELMKQELYQITVVRAPGLYKADDGKWYYYVNDEIDNTYTGLARNEYGWWYVKEGKLDNTYTGLAHNEYGWWYVANGKLDVKYTGMAKNEYGWWYVTNGKLDLTYTGKAQNEYGCWYIKEGKLDITCTGLVKIQNEWWYVAKGKFDETYTGMAKNINGWFYVKNGKADLSYTGLAENEHGTWYMVNGKVASDISGLTKVSKKWMYLVKGKVDTDYVGLAKNDNGWWYVKNGTVDFTYTGMAKNINGWFYVKNGKVDLSYTGLAENEHGTWYMVDGEVASDVSGLTKVSKIWLYLVKGKVDTDYVGLAKNESGWWYVENGTVDFTYTGMAKNQYGWWYVTKGQLDRSFTGIASNENGRWYIKNGEVDFTYTGTVKYNGVTYKIEKGKVV